MFWKGGALEGRFRNRTIDVPKAFVFWKGGLGTEILMFLRHLCFGRVVQEPKY